MEGEKVIFGNDAKQNLCVCTLSNCNYKHCKESNDCFYLIYDSDSFFLRIENFSVWYSVWISIRFRDK